MTPQTIEEAREAMELIAELADIQKRPHRYAKRDETDWMDKQLPKLERLMDSVVADIEWLSQQANIEGQLQLNAELEKALEKAS
jgi:formylglycine-generating enzyme required for sulfatase activity